MKRYFDAKLGMFKAVRGLMTDNAATITAAAVPIIGTYKTDLENKIEAICEKSKQAAVNTKGITQTKTEARFAAIKSAVAIAGAMYSYAIDIANTKLLVEMKNITPSNLKLKKDEEVLDVLNIILAKAAALITVTPPAINPLGNYGIGTPETTALQQLITTYAGLSPAPREVISIRKTNNQELANLYSATDILLIKLDKIMDGLKDSYPLFYSDYQNARMLVGPTRLRTQIAGQVSKVTNIELGTTASVHGARITITALPYTVIKDGQTIELTLEPIIIQTNSEGKFAVPTPDIYATYMVRCTLPGYQEQQVTDVKVQRGKKSQIDFLLVPVS